MIPHRPGLTLFPYTTLFRSYRYGRDNLFRRSFTHGFDRRFHRQSTANSAINQQDRFSVQLAGRSTAATEVRSEEHTSELQSHHDLVCRLLLEKKKTTIRPAI